MMTLSLQNLANWCSGKKSKNTKNESPESSESESSYSVHDETEQDSFDESSDEINEDPQNLLIDENDFVIVRFLGKKKISHSPFLLYWTCPARLKLDCSENVDEEAVEQWINEDSTLECCKVLSGDDIVSCVTCGSEETRNFEECPESFEENLVTHQKLSQGDVLVDAAALLNYLEQEDESTPAEKFILRNLRSIIRQRVNEKQKQTSIISCFTKQ
ncbi:hypothetical protein AVEN_67844-2 [Araneus ventricosus]|uniref:Uncharacterized protein n=2 Tax=Araneus ventricosus TaxID=182803 RepID=A0A4Y2UJ22_ARAVE|nr:hypothetical protein AVEN_67844-2 [Araneus ventricosus]